MIENKTFFGFVTIKFGFPCSKADTDLVKCIPSVSNDGANSEDEATKRGIISKFESLKRFYVLNFKILVMGEKKDNKPRTFRIDLATISRPSSESASRIFHPFNILSITSFSWTFGLTKWK